MSYIFQEYPKNIDGVLVNSKEEEDNILRVRRESEEKIRLEEIKKQNDIKDAEIEKVKPEDRFTISYGGQGSMRQITKKEYLASRFNPAQEEIFDWGYKCYICGKEVSKRKLNDFKRHKETHELAMKIKYGNQ